MKQLLTSIAAVLVMASSAMAQSGLQTIHILQGWQMKDGSQMAAVEMQLAPGWLTYWRVPGDSGLPTLIDWSGSKNIQHLEIIWPRPQVFIKDDLRSIGYKDNVVLPLKITPLNPKLPVDLTANISMGVCADICIAQDVTLRKTITPNGPRNPKIMAAVLDQPTQNYGTPPLCTLEMKNGRLFIDLKWNVERFNGQEHYIVEPENPNIWTTMGETSRHGNWLYLRSELGHIDGHPISLDRTKIRSTVIGDSSAISQLGCQQG